MREIICERKLVVATSSRLKDPQNASRAENASRADNASELPLSVGQFLNHLLRMFSFMYE